MSGKRGKGSSKGTGGEDATLEIAAKTERRLLRAERQAERRLTEARERFARAEGRLARRQAEVVAAEAKLRIRQAARAAGPAAAEVPVDALDLIAAEAPPLPTTGPNGSAPSTTRKRATKRADAAPAASEPAPAASEPAPAALTRRRTARKATVPAS